MSGDNPRPCRRVAQVALRGWTETKRHCRTRRDGRGRRARDVEPHPGGLAPLHRAQGETSGRWVMSEAQQLIDAYLDGELTSEEQGRFAEWLAADAEHIRQFVRESHIHRQIREVMLARPYRAYGLSENR